MFRPARFAFLFLLLALSLMQNAAVAQSTGSGGNWPQWRGPNRDGISLDKGLLKEWPKDGPKQVWQIEGVGAGYSSIAVQGDRIYTQGDVDGVEQTICLDGADGRVVWSSQPAPVAELLITKTDADFQQIDKDKSGKIDELEALQRYGWEWNRYNAATSADPAANTKLRSQKVFAGLDKDSSGGLSYDEAGQLLRDHFERIDAENKTADAAAVAKERTAAYLKLDKDGDGHISKAEAKGTALDRQFGRLDQPNPGANGSDGRLSVTEIQNGLLKHQPGRDGLITADELENYYVSQKATGDGELTKDELKRAIGGYRNGMGDGPRGTPTIDGDRLYVEGGNGDLTCFEASTGKTLWHVNLKNDFGGNTPGWGYSESPLVVDNLVIVTPGGKQGTLLALDKSTGKQVWRSEGVTEPAHYASPVVAEIHGVKQIVQFARESVFGVSLADGKHLWRYTAAANGTANCCTPIIDGELVFASSGYGTGGGLAKITEAGSVQQAEEVYFEKKMACHHGGIVKVGDYMFSNAAGSLLCMDFKTGKIAWQSRSVGKGSLCVADGMLYVLSEGHELALVEATPEEYRERGRFKLNTQHGRPAWAHPVVTGGRLYVRDQQSLTAFDVRDQESAK